MNFMRLLWNTLVESHYLMTYFLDQLKESIIYYIDFYNPASAGFFILKIWEPSYNSYYLTIIFIYLCWEP